MSSSQSGLRRLARIVLAASLAIGAPGWLLNILSAPACHAAIRNDLEARLRSLPLDAERWPQVFVRGPLQWIAPETLRRRTDIPWSLTFPYFAYVPSPEEHARKPYAWVKTGTLLIPYLFPVYEGTLLGGQAGGGRVFLFFSPLGSAGIMSIRDLWAN